MLLHYLAKLRSNMMQIWTKMRTKCIDFASTECNLSSLFTYCWLSYYLIFWFLSNILWNSTYFYLNRPKCWQLPPAHWACVTVQPFMQALRFSFYQVILWWLAVGFSPVVFLFLYCVQPVVTIYTRHCTLLSWIFPTSTSASSCSLIDNRNCQIFLCCHLDYCNSL